MPSRLNNTRSGEPTVPRYIITTHTGRSEYYVELVNRIVSITFYPIWEWLVQVGIVVSIFDAVYMTLFEDENDTITFRLYYFLELIFLFDTVIAYIHRYGVLKFSQHPPRDVVILFIDTISLLPIYECCYIVFSAFATYELQKRLRWKALLRVAHLVATLFVDRFVSAWMQIVVLKLTHVFLLMLLNLMMTCLWSFEGRCWPNCDGPNWTDSLQYLPEVKPRVPLCWFFTCFTTMANIMLHNAPGFIIDHNNIETLIFITTLLIGFILHSFFEVGQTIMKHLEVIQLRSKHCFHKRRLQEILSLSDSTDKLSESTLQYSELLWRVRRGVVMEEVITELPTILLKEVMLDIFYEACKHTHLFENLPYNVIRELCFCMQTEYYLPDTQIDLSVKMMYLHSGFINVMSDEDADTPTMTLSPGTLVGEVSLCLTNIQRAIMRSATICEVKTLSVSDYHRLVARKPASFKHVHSRICTRVDFAKRKSENRRNDKPNFRQQWRYVAEMHAYDSATGSVPARLWRGLDRRFSYKFLDLVVLSPWVVINPKVICVNATCPFILNPGTLFRKFFFYFHLFIICLHTFYFPFLIYDRQLPVDVMPFNFVVDVEFLFDIYLQSISYERDNGNPIFDSTKLLMYKFKNPLFLLDLFTAIPYDYIWLLLNARNAIYYYLRLPKFIQWYKVLKFVIYLQTTITHRVYLMIILKYLVIFFTLIYVTIAYQLLFFNFGQLGPEPISDRWPTETIPVVKCIIHTISTALVIGFNQRTPSNTHEMIAMVLLTLVGSYLRNLCVVEIACNMLQNRQIYYDNYRHHAAVKEFLKLHSIAVKYNKVVNNHYRFLLQLKKDITTKPDINTTEHDIYIKHMINSVRQVPAFANFSDRLVELIAARANVRVHPPGYELATAHTRNIHLHIITQGLCEMRLFMQGDHEKGTVQILKPGDCFNFLEVVHTKNSFNTVTTVTAVQEVVISTTDIWEALETERSELENFIAAIEWHRENNESMLSTWKHSEFLPSNRRNVQPARHVDFFTYVIDDNYDFTCDTSQKKKRGIFSLSKLMLNRTIDPSHRYYMRWELFRDVVALCYGWITFFNATLLKDVDYVLYLLCPIWLVFVIDIYLKFHLQYYNKKNIVITNRTLTFEHYIATSMWLDLIPFMPIPLYPLYLNGVYQYLVNVISSMVFYTALFHRPVQGLTYVQNNIVGIRRNVASIIRHVIYVSSIFCIIGTNMHLSICTYDIGIKRYYCLGTINYVSTSPFRNMTNYEMMIFQLHAVSERMYRDFFGVSEYCYTFNLWESMLTTIFLWTCNLYLLSYFIAAAMGSNEAAFTIAKVRFSKFITVAKRESIAEPTVVELKEHFEYMNTKIGALSVNKILSKLSDRLRLDIKAELFVPVLLKTQLFQTFSIDSLRILNEHLDLQYFKMGADIIRCNDVQKNIYIVSKGQVDIQVASDTVIALTRGGLFGCLSDKGIFRQTIHAQATVHVELLVIDANHFFKILLLYPVLLKKLLSHSALSLQYMRSVPDKIVGLKTESHPSNALSIRMSYFYFRFYLKLNYLIRFTSVHYKRYYLAVIHLGAITSIIQILLIYLGHYWPLACFCYGCDLFFWIHVIISFHLHYLDPDSGIRVEEPSKIRKRYATSYSFWIIFFGSLPLELIPLSSNASEFVTTCFFANRLLRFFIAMDHQRSLNKTILISTWFQRLYIVYVFVFQVLFLSLIWYLVACKFGTCMHRISAGPNKEMGESPNRNKILLSILYAINIFTSSSVRTVSAVTIDQMCVTLLISGVSLIVSSLMIGTLAGLLHTRNIASNAYKSKVAAMLTYFRSLYLSPYLCSKIYQAMVMLWLRRHGELLPKILIDAPVYIRQDVLISLYGEHLDNHDLFRVLHKDMVRQVILLLKVGLYMPGQLIVNAGDMDGCMYFLHRGQVRVVSDQARNSFVVSQPYAFGEEQGIYGIAHTRSYYAYTPVDILLLEKEAWEYLLPYFPASKETIRDAMIFYCDIDEEDIAFL